MSGRLRSRFALFAGLLAIGVGGVAVPSLAVTPRSAAERAADEIEAARQRANEAAQALFDAESRLDGLRLEEEATAQEVADLEARADALSSTVQELAVRRFMSGSGSVPLLSGLDGPTERVQKEFFVALATDTSQATLDEFDAVATDLAEKRERLAAQQTETARAIVELEAAKKRADVELDRLEEIEAKRLADEKVRQILAARRQAAVQSGDFTFGATVFQRYGTAGFLASGVYLDGSIICPVLGSTAFGDTWGAPRSGGRRHEVSTCSARPALRLVAVVSGSVTFKTGMLGGLVATLEGDNGNTYFYGHLSAYEGADRSVGQGDVIGYLGDTGNAQGTPHLHFEIRPNRGRPVNPYPSVRAAC